MAKHWTSEEIMNLARGFQTSCILAAAAELNVFSVLADKPLSAEDLAQKIQSDLRATTILADALAATELLDKQGQCYALAKGTAQSLTTTGSQSVLAMIQHLANCLRSWAQLAKVTKTGQPEETGPSIRGSAGDTQSFIEAMDDLCRPMAESLVGEIAPGEFKHLLDIGAGPATWTIAFLRANPNAIATVFDRPEVIPIAHERIIAAGLEDRVTFVTGDFYADVPLPTGADLAWVSAIVHQNSRAQNRDLFTKVRVALTEPARILIRDVVMDSSRISPPGGALFAVNMLVNTSAGGTFTFDELREDLLAAGFSGPSLLRRDEFMNSIIQATKL